jgi:hypothetical protein
VVWEMEGGGWCVDFCLWQQVTTVSYPGLPNFVILAAFG